MAWIPPYTNWVSVDGVSSVDMNRIEGNILDLNSRINAGMPVIGEYVGDDTQQRAVTLGFRPRLVLIYGPDGQAMLYDCGNYDDYSVHQLGYAAGELDIYQASQSTSGRKITATGFEVGDPITSQLTFMNGLNDKYWYVAFK